MPGRPATSSPWATGTRPGHDSFEDRVSGKLRNDRRENERARVRSISLVRLRHSHRRIAPQIRKLRLQLRHLRCVVDDDVGLVGVADQVILVIGLGREERRLHRAGLGDDRLLEHVGGVELRDVVLRGLRLRFGLRENLRAILRAAVRPLAVELRRVVRHREIDLQELAVGNFLGVEGHLDAFGMAGAAAADGLVVGGLLFAAGIAGHGVGHALDVLEHRLHAPEAAAGKHRGFEPGASRRSFRPRAAGPSRSVRRSQQTAQR